MRRSRRVLVRFLLGERRSSVVALAAGSVLAALSEAGILAITAQVATGLVDGGNRARVRLGPIHLNTTLTALLIVALGLCVLRLVLQIVISYYPAVIAGDVQAAMRSELYAAFTQASWGLQSQDREGHLQELMTNQISQASAGALHAGLMLISAFTFAVLAVSALVLDPAASLVVMVASIGLFFALRPLNRLTSTYARQLSASQLAYAGAVGEANTVAEETQVFGIAATQRSRIGAFIAAARAPYVRTQLLSRLGPSVYQSMIYVTLVAGLMALHLAGVHGFASLGAVVLLLVRAGSYGQLTQSSYVIVRQALPFVERVQDAIDRYEGSRPARGDGELDRLTRLTFQDVGYAYRADQSVLSDLSFEIDGGETVGIVGPSGAGKSTIVQILLGLRAPRQGAYMINGAPLADYSSASWTRQVAYVPQQPRLVYATVADNVRFFRELDDEAVERACRLARIHEEIVSWPHGYETIVGPRAEAVSGGQQQRICLARALATHPSLLILDEPTSALDPHSELLIQESLQALKQGLTLIIVAHRMSTLSICDRIMVLLDGRLDAFDTLESLRRSNQYYRFATALSTR
jgi:ABC-type multidrug transport system fused ATPase/permease subunit